MAIDLLTRAEAGAPLTATEYDTTLATIEDAVNELQGPVTETGGTSYTFGLVDSYGYRRFTATEAVTATVPADATTAFPVGVVLTVRQADTGAVTLDPAAGVTLNPPAGGSLITGGAGATVQIKKVATDEWDVIGQTAAP